jgi:hypothetical protein
MAVKDEVNEVVIEELRRVYDHICRDYNEASVKILAHVGGTLGLLAYLYSGGNLFIPDQTYGRVFYATGIGLVLIPVSFLIYTLRANVWTLPISRKEIAELDNAYTKTKFLEHTKGMYMKALDEDIPLHNRKQIMLNKLTIPLLAGATILLVLKYFGG